MESFARYLNPQYVWIIVGFILMIMEFAIPGLITGFFGLGAIIVGIVCWFVDISLNMQLALFLLCSVVLLLTLRKSFLRLFGLGEALEQGSDQVRDDFVGQHATVTREITPVMAGKVEFHGTSWEAEADEKIIKGSPVEIIDKSNITLKVKRI